MTEPAPGNLWNPPADGTPDVLDALQRLASGEIVAELVTEQAGQVVSLGQAVEGWAVSERTLRRHLGDGTIHGWKASGTYGEEWRVSVDALDAKYRRTDAAAGIVTASQPGTPALADDLRAVIAAMIEPTRIAIESATALATTAAADAAAARAEATAARATVEEARVDAARLEERLRATEADRDRLTVELDAARTAPRRRWFGR